MVHYRDAILTQPIDLGNLVDDRTVISTRDVIWTRYTGLEKAVLIKLFNDETGWSN